eukprot:229362-Lingulodinium_polyedra.AAC.1
MPDRYQSCSAGNGGAARPRWLLARYEKRGRLLRQVARVGPEQRAQGKAVATWLRRRLPARFGALPA